MRCEEIGPLMMGYIDNELTIGETEQVERHLQSCPRCRSELAEFREIGTITSALKFVVPEDEIWKSYWSRIYNRIERNIGWFLLSVGLAFVIIFGAYQGLRDFFSDPSVPSVLKVGVGVGGSGIVILLLSIARERLYFHRQQRYKDIRR
jgi:predicted anti-sigma-YlaC factor YlaD